MQSGEEMALGLFEHLPDMVTFDDLMSEFYVWGKRSGLNWDWTR
jgi:hypothetical protein